MSYKIIVKLSIWYNPTIEKYYKIGMKNSSYFSKKEDVIYACFITL